MIDVTAKCNDCDTEYSVQWTEEWGTRFAWHQLWCVPLNRILGVSPYAIFAFVVLWLFCASAYGQVAKTGEVIQRLDQSIGGVDVIYLKVRVTNASDVPFEFGRYLSAEEKALFDVSGAPGVVNRERLRKKLYAQARRRQIIEAIQNTSTSVSVGGLPTESQFDIDAHVVTLNGLITTQQGIIDTEKAKPPAQQNQQTITSAENEIKKLRNFLP